MPKIDLSNIGNKELSAWIIDHFYYLPEACATDIPKKYSREYLETLLELKEFLYARGYDVELVVKERTND